MISFVLYFLEQTYIFSFFKNAQSQQHLRNIVSRDNIFRNTKLTSMMIIILHFEGHVHNMTLLKRYES